MALLIDMVVLGGLAVFSLAGVLLVAGDPAVLSVGDLVIRTGCVVVVALVWPVFFSGVYFVVLHSYGGQTIGKIFMGIEVVPVEGGNLPLGDSFLRLVGYLLSALPLGAGFFWAVLDKDRAAWHDRLANTRVVAW